MNLPSDVEEIITAIYNKGKKLNPALTEETFFREILAFWLEQYERPEPIKTKKDVRLCNRLKQIFKTHNKTITDIAAMIGIDRPHLSNIANGKAEPSITVALLLEQATGEKLQELFYLEPIGKE
ncbi:MAG: helix-turn-helix transcriptional regulator [Desulfotomaculaceae bacterium]|nr:helix-turn-helix transcriptional regulator [Desulfotomaculaceae bacterium]